ncbi:hypothetical protein P4S63_19580 [Pseudoalteromonas sp. B193]
MHHGESLLDDELKIVAGVLIEQPLALSTDAVQVSNNSVSCCIKFGKITIYLVAHRV